MSEDYAISFRKTIATTPTTGKGWVDALRTVFDNPTYGWNPSGTGIDGRRRWYVDPIDASSGGAVQNAGFLLLRATPQSFSPAPSLDDPNNQQILVSGSLATNQVSFLYAPNGGVDITNYQNTWTVGLSNGANTSGFRNITGLTTAMTLTAREIMVAEHRERLTAGNAYPASALTVFISSTTVIDSEYAFRYGCHVGRIATPDFPEDPTNGVTGDGILTGVPSLLNTQGNWYARIISTNANRDHASAVRVGASQWSLASPIIKYTLLTNAINTSLPPWELTGVGPEYLQTIESIDRIVPHRINAYLQVPVVTATAFGEIGIFKYFRVFRDKLANRHLIASKTIPVEALERQAWLGFNAHTSGNQNQVMLWGIQDTQID
jgi:hypothetical protein